MSRSQDSEISSLSKLEQSTLEAIYCSTVVVSVCSKCCSQVQILVNFFSFMQVMLLLIKHRKKTSLTAVVSG